MPKSFDYSANTTKDTAQYSVTATYGNLSQEIKFSVPAGEECQDKYVLTAPEESVFVGSSKGDELTIPITSTRNGANYQYDAYIINGSGVTVKSKNDTSIVIKVEQDGVGNAAPIFLGMVLVQQNQGGNVVRKTFDVNQKMKIKLETKVIDNSLFVTTSSPVHCPIYGTVGGGYSFNLPYGNQAKVEGAPPVQNGITNAYIDASCDGYDYYELFW